MLTHVQFLLMFLLFVCAGLVSYILHREAKHHENLAITDPLTGIYNRLAFVKALESYIRRHRPFTVFILDLDGFKKINDSCGHQMGDSVLIEFSNRLTEHSSLLRYEVYRIGGDEFAIILDDIEYASIANMETVIEACVEQPFNVTQGAEHMTTSVGLARYPADSDDLNQLISQADHNMYKMKFLEKA